MAGALVLVSPNVSALESGTQHTGAPAPAVPKAYAQTYAILSEALDDFDKYLAAQPKTAHIERAPVFATELLLANANRGTALLKPETLAGVKLELDRFRELGIQGVTLAVDYPLLEPDFPDHEGYADFFRKVAAEVRSRHMKLDVEAGEIFANTAFASNLPAYHYGSATFAAFKSAMRGMTKTIVSELKPDYLNIGAEPDVGARLTGIAEFAYPKRNAEYVAYVLDGLDRGKTKIAAGIGSWASIDYVKALTGTSLDCIDIHIYPFHNAHQVSNAVVASALARASRKCLLYDEVWLSKTIMDTADVAANAEIFKRDAFGFWAPLDQRFIAAIARLARMEGAEFMSPFWSTHFFAYVDHTEAMDRMSYAEVNALVLKGEAENMVADRFSPTGLFYRDLIENSE